MNGIVVLAAIMGAIGFPVLFATMIAELTWRQVTLLAVATALVCGYIVIDNSDTFLRLYWQWTMPAPPPAEAAFIAAADDLRRQRAASQDAAASGLRQAEARLCALPAAADNWVGRVDQMYLTTSGQAATLVVEVWPHVMVRTAFFDDGSNTLIRAPSPMFSAVSALHAGDAVRFAGRIIGHDGACPGDPPVDRPEALRDPEFLLRFADVRPAVTR